MIKDNAFSIILQEEDGCAPDDLNFTVEVFSSYERRDLKKVSKLYSVLKGVLHVLNTDPEYLLAIGEHINLEDVLDNTPDNLSKDTPAPQEEEKVPNGKTIH